MSALDMLTAAIEAAAAETTGRPLIVGICGAQGSGKSTLANGLAGRISGAATLSLDDLYLRRAEREDLAREVHPLLRTRGVPGTHDIELGLNVFSSLQAGFATPLPRFDKALDDRSPETIWPIAGPHLRVLVFEGWCVGATPQDEAALTSPVNALERERDPDGVWRRYVNANLAGPYQDLFSHIDLLVLLAAPDWDIVLNWRLEQEHRLRQSSAGGHGVMTDTEVEVFISHYERLTRHILADMPGRAGLVFLLDRTRQIQSVTEGSD